MTAVGSVLTGTTSLKQRLFFLRSNAHCYIPDYPASGLYLLAAFGMPFFSPQFFFISLLTFYLQTFVNTLLVNSSYPPPTQSPFTNQSCLAQSRLRRSSVPQILGWQVQQTFPICILGVVGAFPPSAWFLMPSIGRRPRCAPQKRLSNSTAGFNFKKHSF